MQQIQPLGRPQPSLKGLPRERVHRQRGTDHQIGRLFVTLRPELLRFASWLSRDSSIAEDVVQQAFLRAWRSREALKDGTAARCWLYTIVRNEHARLYRRRRLDCVSLDGDVDPACLPSLEGPDSDIQAIRYAILKLPLEYREPLVLQVLGGFSTHEIARELKISLTAVLSRLFRARNKLRSICAPGVVKVS